MPNHEIVKCSCGAVISQCGCISHNKAERIVDDACQNCMDRLANVAAEANALAHHTRAHPLMKLEAGDLRFVPEPELSFNESELRSKLAVAEARAAIARAESAELDEIEFWKGYTEAFRDLLQVLVLSRDAHPPKYNAVTGALPTPGVLFARESFDEFFVDAWPLLVQHHLEICHFKNMKLEVDVERYRAIETAGGLRIYTVRQEETRKLIGYAVFFMARNLHYWGSVQANEDVLFVDPEFRHGRTGLRLIQFAEGQLVRDGVEVIYHHAKVVHPAFGRLLEATGYQLIDQIYGKRIS